jgi:hypothetical protein
MCCYLAIDPGDGHDSPLACVLELKIIEQIE